MNELKFLKYVKNEMDPKDSYGLMGIASILYKGEMKNYCVKEGKDGQGFFVAPFSQKMNNLWFKSSVLDSSIENKDVMDFIREHVKSAMAEEQGLPQELEEAPF